MCPETTSVKLDDPQLIFVAARPGTGAPWIGAEFGLALVIVNGRVGWMWAADLKALT
jgi:hypothetical protein